MKEKMLKEDELTYVSRCSGKLLEDPRRYRLIDLFSGAGGMSLGFSEVFGQPFQTVWANDFNQFCVDTYSENFGPHCIAGDIVEILEKNQVVLYSVALPQSVSGLYIIGLPPSSLIAIARVQSGLCPQDCGNICGG